MAWDVVTGVAAPSPDPSPLQGEGNQTQSAFRACWFLAPLPFRGRTREPSGEKRARQTREPLGEKRAGASGGAASRRECAERQRPNGRALRRSP